MRTQGLRYGLCRAVRRCGRVYNRPVSASTFICQMAEHVVAIEALAVGQDALVDGRDTEFVGKALGSFVELVVPFDDLALVGLLARHEVIVRVLTEKESTGAVGGEEVAELGRGRKAKVETYHGLILNVGEAGDRFLS